MAMWGLQYVARKVGRNDNENVTSCAATSWPCDLICNSSDDIKDITDHSHKLMGQINNVLCTCSCLDLIVWLRLLINYCLSLYGFICELGSRVVSMMDSVAEGPGIKSQPRRCRVIVIDKLFTPIVPLFTKERNW